MSRTVKKAQSVEATHASRAAAAYQHLAKDIAGVPAEKRAQPNVDMQDAALGALGVIAQIQTPEVRADVAKLASVKLVNGELIDEAEKIAWAALHVRRKLVLTMGTITLARLTDEAETRTKKIRDRMFALVEYHFGDDPELAPVVAYIRSGTGLLDRANDMEALADIYVARAPAVARDPKHYVATDVADARAGAQEIYEALGIKHESGEPDWALMQPAAWALLTTAYAEVQRVGRFLFAHDRGDERFPSLVTVARTAPHAAKDPAAPGATTASDPKPGA